MNRHPPSCLPGRFDFMISSLHSNVFGQVAVTHPGLAQTTTMKQQFTYLILLVLPFANAVGLFAASTDLSAPNPAPLISTLGEFHCFTNSATNSLAITITTNAPNTLVVVIESDRFRPVGAFELMRVPLPASGWCIQASAPDRIWFYGGKETDNVFVWRPGPPARGVRATVEMIRDEAPFDFRGRLPSRLGGLLPAAL